MDYYSNPIEESIREATYGLQNKLDNFERKVSRKPTEVIKNFLEEYSPRNLKDKICFFFDYEWRQKMTVCEKELKSRQGYQTPSVTLKEFFRHENSPSDINLE